MQHTTSPTQPSVVPLSSFINPQEEDPVIIAENRVVALLDELENIGALQRSNRMELAEFLNPPEEVHGIDAATDEDIFDAVMEARRGEESGHDGDDIDTNTLEPIPTRVEALKAASTIFRYTQDKDGASWNRR